MFKSVSIIIPALNEERHIAKCLHAISALDKTGLEVETIVVDNGSTDSTVEIARAHGALVLVKPGVNVSAVRNHGVEHSRGDLLAFVDADCTVSKDWLKNALRTFASESADAVGSCHLIPEEAGWIGRIAELVQSKRVGSDVKYIPSGNMLVKRRCFELIGGFMPSLETSEDVDFCSRLRRHGYKIFLDPKISAVHLGAPMGVREMFRREMWHGKTMFPVFLSDLRSGKKLRSVRNLSLIMFSTVNLIFIIGMVAGVYQMIRGENTLFMACAALYLFLNFAMAIRDWVKVKQGLLYLFGYIVIYGIARSLSLARGVLKEGLGIFGNAARTR